jgi:hypothetical protein
MHFGLSFPDTCQILQIPGDKYYQFPLIVNLRAFDQDTPIVSANPL